MADTQERKQTSLDIQRKTTAEYYERLGKAKENGQKVAWVNGIFPSEFLLAADVAVAYPENHAAMMGAKKGAQPYIDKCEALGYCDDLCSYARISLGYQETFDSDIENLPKPDFVCCCSNVCMLCIKWFEAIARRFDVPYILIDVPFQTEYGPTESDIDYIVAQFNNMVKQLEIITETPFNYEKFYEIMKISRRVADSWFKAMQYVLQKPSPLDGFNMFNYVSQAIMQRGEEVSVDLYDYVADEMEEYMKEGKSQFKGEQKFRVFWEGIACWPHLRTTYSTMRKNDMIVTGTYYPRAWHIVYEFADMRSMAKAYAMVPASGGVRRRVDLRDSIMQEADCDGIILHNNRSCKLNSFIQLDLKRRLYERNQKPSTRFDGDQTDPNHFSEAQFLTRIQALRESMVENQIASGGEKNEQ